MHSPLSAHEFNSSDEWASAIFSGMKSLIITVLFISICAVADDRKGAEERSQAAVTSCRGLLQSWGQARAKELQARTQQVSKDRLWVGLYQSGNSTDEYICSVQCKDAKTCVTKWAQGPDGVVYKPR